MDKSLLIKLAVVGIILAFVIETFAFGVLGNPNANPGGNAGGNAQSGGNFQGNAIVNATVVSYKPNLIVQGEGAAVREAIRPLVASGAVIYTGEPDEQNRTLLNLASGVDIGEVFRNLSAANLTVYANAVIGLPAKFNITTPEGQIEVEGTTFELGTPDVWGGNETVQMSIYMTVKGGKILQLQNPVFMQEKAEFSAMGEVAEVRGAVYVVSIPFGQRRVDRKLASELFGRGNYSFEIKEISYIAFEQPLTQEKLAQLNFPYVTYSQPQSISIDPSFSNGTRLQEDFASAGLNVTVPSSYIRVAGKGNASTEEEGVEVLAIAKRLASDATMQVAYKVEIALPESVEAGGKSYSGIPAKITSVLGGEPQVGDRVNVTISGWVSGSRLVKVDSVSAG